MRCAIWTKCLLLLLTAAVLAIGVPSASAQGPAAKSSPESIVLPVELVAGQPATLAVLSADGRIAAGVKLVLSNGEIVSTDESGRAHFLGPSEAGILIARILETETRAAADVAQQKEAMKLEIARVPSIAAIKDQITITGNGFQGDADRNHIELGGKPAFVLAASPKELVILASPQTTLGSVVLTVKVSKLEASKDVTLVDVSPDAIQNSVRTGKSATFAIHVRGTIQRVDLEVQNMSPETVRFKHGDVEYVRTQGGAENSATIAVKGTHPGEFSCAVRLKPQPGSANVQAARDFLQAAEKLAEAGEKRRIDNILAKLGPRKADIAGARKEFTKISTVNSAGDFEALIRAAGEALNGQ